MTTPYEAYNRGAIALAEHFDIGRVSASDFVLDNNTYPKDENAGWTLFKPSDDIDYRALDGREVKLMHEDGAEMTFTLRRDPFSLSASTYSAWDTPTHTGAAFINAWRGQSVWKMYIKGDLPTKRVTADTLKPGDIVDICWEMDGETWENAICVAPGKIAVAENDRARVFSGCLEKFIVTAHLGRHPAYKEEA